MLYTARTRVVDGRGGVEVAENILVQTWPRYLGVELGAAKPTLSLPDVKQMVADRLTPRYHAMEPRPLSVAEAAPKGSQDVHPTAVGDVGALQARRGYASISEFVLGEHAASLDISTAGTTTASTTTSTTPATATAAATTTHS